MNLTAQQEEWLDRQGGRTIEDVHVDKEGMFVYMYNGYSNKDERIYLPLDEEI